MNYMILAAGKGSRMGTLSTYLQKCMYPILDRPFLELTLRSIMDNPRFDPAHDRIIMVVGHLRHQVEAYFGTEWRGSELRYVVQHEALGTAYAVLLGYAACEPADPTIVVQADVWAEPAFFEALIDNPLPDALSVHRHECSFRHDERVDVVDGLVTRAWKGSGPFVECGIWKFSPDMIAYMMRRKDDEYRALASVQAAIEDGRPVAAVERSRWMHLGATEPGVAENLAEVVSFFCGQPHRWY
jgi:NDP-sugar pyrophosphorylase family protein